MAANLNPFTQQMCDRLTTTCMGLGLVRLLQDAKRFEEARTTLRLLENGFQEASAKTGRKSRREQRLPRPQSRTPAHARIEAA